MVDALGGFLEVGWFRGVDVKELLRVTVDEREPGALDLHHDAVVAPECMVNVGHDIFDFRDLVWDERCRGGEAVTEFPAHHFAANELLIAGHDDVSGIGIWIGGVGGIDID